MTDSPRRTQAERRAETIAKVIDATIAAIAEVGYHRTSIGEIGRRAGVSKGGIFRHFDSRTDLVVAAAEEVARRHMAVFEAFRDAGNSLAPLDTMRLGRDQIRDETRTVWFELLVAARTEPELRARLAPVAKAMVDSIEQVTRAGAIAAGESPEAAVLITTSLLHMFDGEAIFRHTYPRPELEDSRIEYIAKIYQSLQP